MRAGTLHIKTESFSKSGATFTHQQTRQASAQSGATGTPSKDVGGVGCCKGAPQWHDQCGAAALLCSAYPQPATAYDCEVEEAAVKARASRAAKYTGQDRLAPARAALKAMHEAGTLRPKQRNDKGQFVKDA